MNLLDHTVVARAGSRQILRHHYPVQWNDGSAIALHVVLLHELPNLFERALPLGRGAFALFSLPQLAPSLDADMRSTHDRDIAGLVLYTLRQRFGSARACTDAIRRHAFAATALPPPAAEAPASSPARRFGTDVLDAAQHEALCEMRNAWIPGAIA